MPCPPAVSTGPAMPIRDAWFLTALKDDVAEVDRLATAGSVNELRNKLQSLYWATAGWLEAMEQTCSSSVTTYGPTKVRLCNKPVGHSEELHSDGFAVWRSDTPDDMLF